MHWLSKWLPPLASSYGSEIDGIFRTIYWITCATFLLVTFLLVAFLVKFRARPGRKAVYSHGNNTLELAWTVVPALILVWLAVQSQRVWGQVRQQMPPIDYTIGVSARQFNWDIAYPGKDGALGEATPAGKFTGADNVVGPTNTLDVPVDRNIRITLASQDVIHSLFLPNFRFKQDALPGRTVDVWFRPVKTGVYDIACAELCGMGHTTMRGTIRVHDAASWAEWLKKNPNAFPEEGASR